MVLFIKMKKTRATAIILKNEEVLLIHRKNEKEYYVFPGGGVEEGETTEQALLRELKEETSLVVRVDKLLEKRILNNGIENYCYLCTYISGNPQLAKNSPERAEMKNGIQYYNPVWMNIKDLEDLDVWPEGIKNLI